MTQTIIRLVLTTLLLYVAYGETGWATKLILTLLAAQAELMAYIARRGE